MRTISSALNTALGKTVTQPGWLVFVNWPTPVRLSSLGTVTYGGQTFSAANVDVSNLRMDGMKVSGSISLGNADNGYGSLVLTYGIAGTQIKVWGFDGDAVASDDDFVFMADAVGGKSKINLDKVAIDLRDSTAFVYSPRTYVTAPTFTYLIPAGTILKINDQTFKVER